MGCLSSSQKTYILNKIEVLDEQLLAANAAYLECLSSIKNYQFSSGEGSMTVTRQDAKKMLEVISMLQSQRDRLQNRLDGTGIVNLNLRR
jgi:hypothetical protein